MFLQYMVCAVAHTRVITDDEVSEATEFMLFEKWNPIILVSLWYGISIVGTVVSQFSMIFPRDFRLFIFAPEADSYRINISSHLGLSSTCVR